MKQTQNQIGRNSRQWDKTQQLKEVNKQTLEDKALRNLLPHIRECQNGGGGSRYSYLTQTKRARKSEWSSFSHLWGYVPRPILLPEVQIVSNHNITMFIYAYIPMIKFSL